MCMCITNIHALMPTCTPTPTHTHTHTQKNLVESLEGELTTLKSELSFARQSHSEEKKALTETAEEMRKKVALTEAQTKSDKVDHLCVGVCVCVCACVRVCVHVCDRVCECVCVCVFEE